MKGEMYKCVDSRAVSVTVWDCEPLPIQRPYVMHPTGTLLPGRVDIRWEGGKLMKLTVSGLRLKNDGTVGKAESTTTFVYYGNDQQPGKQPDWLQMLVQGYAPASAVKP